MATDLDQLKAVFDLHREEWISAGHEGEWVLIGEEGVHGFHESYEDAVTTAASAFGAKTCLIQQVLHEDRTENIQHVFWTA